MTRDELLEKIHECRKLNDRFESAHDIGMKSNTAIRVWLDEVEQDLVVDIIPEKIREVISHNIEELRLNHRITAYTDPNRIFHREQYENDRMDVVLRSVQFRDTYRIYKSVGFVEKNTVLVGANGCGKTTLANTLRNTLDLQDGIVIPAQKLLLVPTFDNIPTLKSERGLFNQYQKKVIDDKQTYPARNQGDFPYNLAKEYGSEYRNVLALLIAERNAKRNEIIDTKQEGTEFKKEEFKTTIDTVIEIWNYLIPHRKMLLDPDSNLIIKYYKGDDERNYEAYRMSDGERIILYLVGRIMQAPKNGLIIVDEPEVYLHRTVVDKLWSRLEKERKDCIFIYMTHDLQFATSRVGVKSWIKSYEYPSTWDIQIIQDNEIPEQLLMELLGSCKQILFCEGNSTNSLDKKIFDVLFPNFIIYPLKSCKEVISYTKAYNAIPNTNTKAFGLVDSDFRSPEEINELKTNNIFTYHVAEIENVFLIEDFMKAFMEHHRWSGDVEKIKSNIIALLDKNKEAQAANYVSARIDYFYRKNHMAKGNNKAEVEQRMKEFNNDIQLDKWYEYRLRELELCVKNLNYVKTIAVYNNKGLHAVVEQEFGIKNYNEKALEYLKVAPEHVVEKLRDLFPEELIKNN